MANFAFGFVLMWPIWACAYMASVIISQWKLLVQASQLPIFTSLNLKQIIFSCT